jgi:hypothetical protein
MMKLSREEIGARVLARLEEIKQMPTKVYGRWIEGRVNDLLAFSLSQIAAFQEDGSEFDRGKLQMEASAIPLAAAYMLGRKDAAQRFSRVLIAMRRYLGSFDPDNQPSRGKLYAVINRALEVYGWPASEKRAPSSDDPDFSWEGNIPDVNEKGGDDLDEILHDLR